MCAESSASGVIVAGAVVARCVVAASVLDQFGQQCFDPAPDLIANRPYGIDPLAGRELPLAWPVIITGIRVTTLILLGIAAIGAIVNGPGYGELIFTGLARVGTPVAVNLVMAGTLGVVVLAVLFDLLFHAVRRLTTSRGIR